MASRFNRSLLIGLSLIISCFLYQCISDNGIEVSPLGIMEFPEDNPSTDAKIELGRTLFFDPRLSRDNTISCASCHVPEYAFTDRKRVSIGVDGGVSMRNAPSLLNAGFLKTVMFDAHLENLEMQVTVPIQEHVEMDLSIKELIKRLQNIPEYQKAAKEIYNRDFDAWVLTRSIAAFERSLLSDNSRFDKYYYGKDKSAMSASEIAGWKLFSEKLYCTQCHPAPYFTTFIAENNGLYEDYGEDQGRFRIHNDTADMGKFKIPSLRNVALTYPYMHDGSIGSLKGVIEHYQSGGKLHINKSDHIRPFKLNNEQKSDLVNFFNALTDTSYMRYY